MGQHYSFAQAVDESGRRVWRFSPLLVPRDEDTETFIMSVFRAVPLSCITEGRGFKPADVVICVGEEEPEPPTPGKVIEMRPRRKAPPVDMPETLAA